MRAFGKRGGSNNQNDEGFEDENLPPEDYYQEEFSASTLDSEQGDDDWDSLSDNEDSVLSQAEEMKHRSSPIARMIPWFALGVIVAGGIVYYLTANMGSGVIQPGSAITATPVAPSTNTTDEQFAKPMTSRATPSSTSGGAASTSSGSPETSASVSMPALPSDTASASAQTTRSGSFIPSDDGTIKWVEPVQSPDQTANKGNVTETGTATSASTTATAATNTPSSVTEQTETSQPQTTPIIGSQETVETPVTTPPDFSKQMASINSSSVTDKPVTPNSQNSSAAQETVPLKEQTTPTAPATPKNISTANDQHASETAVAVTPSTSSSDAATNERSPESLLMSAMKSTADQAKIPPVETPAMTATTAPTTALPAAAIPTTANVKPTGASSVPSSSEAPIPSAVTSSGEASSATSAPSPSGLTSTLVPTLAPTTSVTAPVSSQGLGVSSSISSSVDATKTPSASTEDVDDLNSRMAVLEQRLGDLTQALDKVAVQSTSKSSATSEQNTQAMAQAGALNTQLSAQIKSLQSEMQSLKSQVKDQSRAAVPSSVTTSPVVTSVENKQPPKTIPLLPSKPQTESHKVATASSPAQANSAKAWELRAAQAGEAWVARKGSDNLQHVTVGQSVSGLGRVTSIREKNGAWVVVTTGGTLRQ